LLAFRSEVKAAWAEFPVKVGLLGVVIIVIGSLTPAYLPQASPVWPFLRTIGLAGEVGRISGTVLTVSGVFLVIDAWFRLRHTRYRSISPLAIMALWSLPFLISPPIFSHDMYSYGAQGWMVHNGQNPYDGGPGLVPGPFSDYTPWVWRYMPAPYGPLALQISHLMVDMSGGHPWVAALLMRIPALIGVACVVILLPKIAVRIGADVDKVSWFACLNPLLLIDYVGGGHNDGWMMGVLVVGLWVATHPRWWPLASMIVAVAASIKQPAFLAAVFLPLVCRPLGTWRDAKATFGAIGKAVASVAIAAAVFAGVTWACGLGYGWIDALAVPGAVPSISPSYIIGSLLQTIIDPTGISWITATMRVCMALGMVFIAYATIRYGLRSPLKALSWSWIAAALAASALHSWYLLWGGLLLPLSPSRRRMPWPAVVVVVFLLGHAAMNMGDRNGTFAIIAGAVCLLAWMAHIVVYHRVWPRLRRSAPLVESSPEDESASDVEAPAPAHPGARTKES